MANLHRGEISATFSGKRYTLVLTLGALAELEEAFACKSLRELAQVFSDGQLSANDLVAVIGAGLRGAGHDLDDDAVSALGTEGGLVGMTQIAARLLAVTFGSEQGDGQTQSRPNKAARP